ncbi:hypothetical protein C2U70_10815 [Bradyrhizobium guangdongense]|uniref:hypothetical protein n=1 Tax=Bradyrhizobium guangdongense TaxID=1325090 RepID=UPI00112DF8A9|nr:hypothetical protein [Bradyrhizobium guangdongense]TPQ37562.1 hypothetical protein C2U70_10815 [Bradyrhizobium guangdongense]
MKFLTGCVAAATLVLAAAAADAQVLVRSPYLAASDFDGPYGPPGAPPPPPRQGYGYGYGSPYGYEQAPGLLPATEVYAVLRENGFSPLGIPRLRGTVYTIAVIDRRGDDGRLVIDARDGRILRFVPAYGAGPAYGGPAYEEGALAPYGAQGSLPPPTTVRSAAPRPPATIPHVASRSVPLPKAAPHRGETPVAAAKPAVTAPAPQATAAPAQPAQQTSAVQAKPAEATPAAAATVGQAKPAPTILPTQDMPAAQGLD